MEPKIWGPKLWFFLHTMTFAYAENKDKPTKAEQKHMYQFLESLKYVLPCVCKDNYAWYFDTHPPNLSSRKKLFEWVVDLHNHVNEEYNKSCRPEDSKRIYTYNEVEQMYKFYYSRK